MVEVRVRKSGCALRSVSAFLWARFELELTQDLDVGEALPLEAPEARDDRDHPVVEGESEEPASRKADHGNDGGRNDLRPVEDGHGLADLRRLYRVWLAPVKGKILNSLV
jgi:hypothetical protein